MNSEAYQLAQQAIANLKSAIYLVLESAPSNGLTNAEIGRSLGIYAGHVGHEGHIPRTVLGLLESEGVVQQDSDSKRWTLRRYPENS
ncbi:hypothetical protein Pan97_23470 [Bremerella volcania]|uniref:HTH iclR-type domain-containing protein n=1 Tax=Bremerella volcania TaxID=2527984 RepID=A0A518C7W1_9BACT|nr:hypothetical protein Pan97_23470 [Bremerella volcania]